MANSELQQINRNDFKYEQEEHFVDNRGEDSQRIKTAL